MRFLVRVAIGFRSLAILLLECVVVEETLIVPWISYPLAVLKAFFLVTEGILLSHLVHAPAMIIMIWAC